MNVIWTCPYFGCKKRQEKTSHLVPEIKHEHNGHVYFLTPFKKEKRKPEDETVKSLDDKLWKEFSKFIRLRDADTNGIIICCTCGKRVHWKDADAGHFISRRHKVIKYDEKNVHAQCKNCNGFKHGNEKLYYDFMLKKYGQMTITKLEAAKRTSFSFTKNYLKVLLDIYKRKVYELENRGRVGD